MSTEDRWCACVAFVLWYFEGGIYVCKCGHPDVEHIDGNGTCMGEVTVYVH